MLNEGERERPASVDELQWWSWKHLLFIPFYSHVWSSRDIMTPNKYILCTQWSLCLPIATRMHITFLLHLLKQGKRTNIPTYKIKSNGKHCWKIYGTVFSCLLWSWFCGAGKKQRGKNVFFRRLAVFISRVKRNVHRTPILPLTDYKFYFMHIFKFINKRVRAMESP